MDEQLREDWLDARLRDEAPYIDDAGFTAQVIQKLPAPQPRQSLRVVILICVTLLASAFAYVLSDGGQFLIRVAERLASLPLLFTCAVAIACGLIITVIVTGAAVSQAREPR